MSDSKDKEESNVHKSIFGEERDLTRGVVGMLKLAAEKGYLDNPKSMIIKPVVSLKHLESTYIEVDEKEQAEDKYIRKLERMASKPQGPLRAFSEKTNYKPDVNIAYTDKSGNVLGKKEAYREFSHKFHGKRPGKKKIEKRHARLEKINKMKSMGLSVPAPK